MIYMDKFTGNKEQTIYIVILQKMYSTSRRCYCLFSFYDCCTVLYCFISLGNSLRPLGIACTWGLQYGRPLLLQRGVGRAREDENSKEKKARRGGRTGREL